MSTKNISQLSRTQQMGWTPPPWVSVYHDEMFSQPTLNMMPVVTTVDNSVTGVDSYYPWPVANGAGATGGQVNNWDGSDDTNFAYDPGLFETINGANSDLALRGELLPGGSSQAARYCLNFSFETDSNVVEIEWYAGGSLQIQVNGRFISDKGFYRNGAAGGNRHTTKLTFNDIDAGRDKVIKVFTQGGQGLIRVVVDSGASFSKPSYSSLKIAHIGDSWGRGSGATFSEYMGANAIETWLSRLVRLIGGPEVQLINASIGASGFNAGGASAYPERIAEILSLNPDLIITYGSQNDGLTDLSGMYNNAESVWSDIQTAGVECFHITTLLSSYSVQNDEMLNRFNNVFGSTTNFINMTGFVNGSGNTGSAINLDGTAGYMRRGLDPNHMSHTGHVCAAYEAFCRFLNIKGNYWSF